MDYCEDKCQHLLQDLAYSRCTILGSQDFQDPFITINTITPPVFTFLPQTGSIHVNIVHKVHLILEQQRG